MTHKHLTLSIIAGLLLLAPAEGLYAQSRSETSLYKKTMKKPTVKAADKFLKKYPSSVYAPKVQQMKDSLLYLVFVEKNVSQISHETALNVAGKALDAIGWKKDGQEHILSLEDDFSLRVLSPDGVLQERRFLNSASSSTLPTAWETVNLWKPSITRTKTCCPRPSSTARPYPKAASRARAPK